MKKSKVVIVGVIALALSGIGVGAAVASTGGAHQGSASITTSDPIDAVIDPNEAVDPADESDGTSTEATTADDGKDGGHEDPEGVDAQHEGGADEK